MSPIIRLTTADTNTAPAAISFMIFMAGCILGSTMSQSFSIDALIISSDITIAVQRSTAIHSVFEMCSTKPVAIAMMAKHNSSLPLGSLLKKVYTPRKAYIKAFNSFIYQV